MKKRKEEILRNKEQSTEQSIVQSKEQSKEQSSVQSTEQFTVQPTEQSNNTYVIKEEILRNKEQPATVAEKPDGLLITTMAAITAGIFFVLWTTGAAQHDPLLASTTWAWLMSFPYRRQR